MGHVVTDTIDVLLVLRRYNKVNCSKGIGKVKYDQTSTISQVRSDKYFHQVVP